MGLWGTSTDLVEAVTRQLVASRPSHMAGQPGGMASTTFLQHLGLPLLVLTRVHKVGGQIDLIPGRSAGELGWPLGPFNLGFGPLGPHVKYTPVVIMILAFGQLHFLIP
jgi:hypothetical protein